MLAPTRGKPAEVGKKTPGGTVLSFSWRFIRSSSVFGRKVSISAVMPLFASVPNSETSQRLLLRLRAMWEGSAETRSPGSIRAGHRGWACPGGGGVQRWVGESRNCVVALLPQLLLSHGYLLPLLPRSNILPISVFLLGG